MMESPSDGGHNNNKLNTLGRITLLGQGNERRSSNRAISISSANFVLSGGCG